MTRHLVIVAQNQPALATDLAGQFSGNEKVRVILDRRRGERRQRVRRHVPERRRADRRRRPAINHSLRNFAFVVICQRQEATSLGEKRDGVADAESKEAREQAGRWIDEAVSHVAVLREVLHGYNRLRVRANAAEREIERLRGLVYELEQFRAHAERERQRFHEEVSRLRGQNDRYLREREEMADAVTRFMTEILSRLRGQQG